MTEIKALQKTIDMWTWLKDHPGNTKRDYLDLYDPWEELNAECYLCSYYHACKECPLDGCHYYIMWEEANDENSPELAKLASSKIINSCQNKLNELLDIEAVEKTRDMWVWLKEDPTRTKEGYFDVVVYEENRILDNCYLCDRFRKNIADTQCKNCPLYLWGQHCFMSGSSYQMWYNKYGEEKYKHASNIVEICEMWLDSKKHELNNINQKYEITLRNSIDN